MSTQTRQNIAVVSLLFATVFALAMPTASPIMYLSIGLWTLTPINPLIFLGLILSLAIFIAHAGPRL